jgi:hypothetical protein
MEAFQGTIMAALIPATSIPLRGAAPANTLVRIEKGGTETEPVQ